MPPACIRASPRVSNPGRGARLTFWIVGCVQLMVIEEGTGEYVKTAKTKAAVFAALGFKADLSSTFMVRNGGIKSFYKGSFDKVFATSSYEFA